MTRHPLLWAAVVLALGVGCAPLVWPWRPILCAAGIAGGLGLVIWYWWRRGSPPFAAGLLIFLIGTLLPAPPLPAGQTERVTAIRAWLDGEVRIQANRVYGGARITGWRLGNGPWSRPPRGLRVWIADSPADAGYGAYLEARGKLLQAQLAGYDGYFFPKLLTPLPGRGGNVLRRAGLALRGALDTVYRRFLRDDQRGLLAGLVLGDLPQMSPEALDWFRDAGAFHLLSVSGLHVGFVVALLLGVAGLIGWRGWRAWVLVVPAVAGYVFLCGTKPPILRAGVMALAAGAGAISGRKTDPGNLLGLAAIVILFWQPWALGTISFQLTFVACTGLVFLYPRWAAWCPPKLAVIGKPLLISMAASLAILPVQLAAFGRVSLIGPLANLILVPLAGLATQVGLIGGLIGIVVPWVAGPLLTGLGLVLDFMLKVAAFCARIPGSAVNLGAWSWPMVAVYYLLLGMVGFGMERNLLNRRSRMPPGWLLVVLLGVLAAFVWWQVLAAPSGLAVTFLDVGQGDSIFIRAPGGRTALIDAGEAEEGQRVLSDLRKQGVNRLDLMIVSHPHSDHVGGLSAVANGIAVGQVIDPGWPHPAETYRQFLLTLKEKGIPWRRARRGLRFTLGREVTGTILYPSVNAVQPEDLNEGSLVILLKYGDQSILLPGDLEARGEQELLSMGQDLHATVLKAAHHGSATGTGTAWLDAIRPRAAVISVGRGNAFRHPSGEVLGRLAAAGIKVYRTDERGTIRWVTDGNRHRFETGK